MDRRGRIRADTAPQWPLFPLLCSLVLARAFSGCGYGTWPLIGRCDFYRSDMLTRYGAAIDACIDFQARIFPVASHVALGPFFSSQPALRGGLFFMLRPGVRNGGATGKILFLKI